MAVKFLSDEWMSEVESALNAHDGFQAAAKGQAAKLQQDISGGPSGDVTYGFVIEGGTVKVTPGPVDGAEATINQDYETASAMSRGELTGQAAFMQGKLKVSGNLMKMMQLQGVFTAMPQALANLEIEY